MNIIERMQAIVQAYPQIYTVLHIDYCGVSDESVGLSSTGDSFLKEDVLGNQIRQHNFVLYATYQSLNDFDRLTNSGALLELAQYLETQGKAELPLDGGYITNITTANGMLYEIPSAGYNLLRYQLQIAATYKLIRED